jgi:hypothetical protein
MEATAPRNRRSAASALIERDGPFIVLLHYMALDDVRQLLFPIVYHSLVAALP